MASIKEGKSFREKHEGTAEEVAVLAPWGVVLCPRVLTCAYRRSSQRRAASAAALHVPGAICVQQATMLKTREKQEVRSMLWALQYALHEIFLASICRHVGPLRCWTPEFMLEVVWLPASLGARQASYR